jgi:glycerophosphoryl diester phosphodiesterase
MIVIAHRGASGLLPEHTLAAYRLAIEQGADFIEPDVVLTADGAMIVRHEPMLDETTDVADRFPTRRRTTRDVDGVPTTAYFACDFTLAEIRTLRARQAWPGRSKAYDGLHPIPTLAEVLALARAQSARLGRTIGVYPETKHPSFHDAIFGRMTFEEALIGLLHEAYGNRADAPVFIQSFETANLRHLRTRTRLRLTQLIGGAGLEDDGSVRLTAPMLQPRDLTLAGDPRSFADLLTPSGLDFIATYADAIGPWKPFVLRTVRTDGPLSDDRVAAAPTRRVAGGTGLVEAAHARGLQVHPWTFRDDAGILGFVDPIDEIRHYFALGVDGVFTDFPATGHAARSRAKTVERSGPEKPVRPGP